jgi:hypothetical protein
MMYRVITDIALFISLFIFPWWFVVVLAVIALFFFNSYYEVIFLGVIIDSLYNAPIARFHGFEFVVTIAMVLLYILAEVLKRRLRFYNAK